MNDKNSTTKDSTEQKTLDPDNQGYADADVTPPDKEDSGVHSHEDFKQLSLADIKTLTGLERGDKSESEYREDAWESYKTDVKLQAQYGTARQGNDLPEGV